MNYIQELYCKLTSGGKFCLYRLGSCSACSFTVFCQKSHKKSPEKQERVKPDGWMG